MRNKIQRNMVFVIVLTLLTSYAFIIGIVYNQTYRIMQQDARQEASYIKEAINLLGSDYLQEMDDVNSDTRVTQIDQNGKVLYDSHGIDSKDENHARRKEVMEALENGTGQDKRVSETVGQELFYYATLLDDGTVLRVAKSMDGVSGTAVRILPYMFGIGLILVIVAWRLSKWVANRLVQPINELDLEHPIDNDVYEELTPLLLSMENQKKEKEKNEQMRKEFSANVSHELKTPLTSISGYAEIMKSGLVKQEDVPGFAERIYKEASRLIVLVEDIIKLSKLDEGGVGLGKEKVDLYSICEDVLIRLENMANRHHVSMELSGEKVEYEGVYRVLDEMVWNLCENAVKYNKPGGHVHVWVGNTLSGPKIIVKDTGIGIPKEEQERIFERFYRVDKSHSKETGGTGLGLSIVKHGAVIHNIQIRTDSEVGKGTAITLSFSKGNSASATEEQ